MAQKVKDIRRKFISEFEKKNFVKDKTGSKIVELIGESFIADEPIIFGERNDVFADKEINWYMTKEQNINWMQKPIPELWKSVASPKGDVNSNYGNLVFSHQNFNQFENVLCTLKKDSDSRRAIMIYTRPTMHTDFRARGKNDFICTNTVQYFIRKNRLECVVNMRSNDAVFGYIYDLNWQQCVQLALKSELEEVYPKLSLGKIFWQAGSLHVYERHFKYLEGGQK